MEMCSKCFRESESAGEKAVEVPAVSPELASSVPAPAMDTSILRMPTSEASPISSPAAPSSPTAAPEVSPPREAPSPPAPQRAATPPIPLHPLEAVWHRRPPPKSGRPATSRGGVGRHTRPKAPRPSHHNTARRVAGPRQSPPPRAPPLTSPPQADAATPLAALEQATPPDAAEGGGAGDGKPVQKNRGRCFECRKKVGLVGGFECKCGYVFCSGHRMPDDHCCSFDFKTEGMQRLADENQEVKASRVAGF